MPRIQGRITCTITRTPHSSPTSSSGSPFSRYEMRAAEAPLTIPSPRTPPHFECSLSVSCARSYVYLNIHLCHADLSLSGTSVGAKAAHLFQRSPVSCSIPRRPRAADLAGRDCVSLARLVRVDGSRTDLLVVRLQLGVGTSVASNAASRDSIPSPPKSAICPSQVHNLP